MNEVKEIRKPAVAGSFYPGDPLALSKDLAELFSKAPKEMLGGQPLALIAPHAGYKYSGQTAANAYKQLEGLEYETVIVISPSHTIFFQGASVFNGDAYQTPLGEIEIDKELSQTIASINPAVYSSRQGHTGGPSRGEHSLEVHLPFLQQILGKFKLVAIVMGDQESDTCRSLGEVLGSTLKEKNCLIVASTDLSHFHKEKEARLLDGQVQKTIEQYNPEKLLAVISSGSGEACGAGPVAAAMIATQRMEGREIKITGYTTSGEATGDFSEVVGYLSAVILADKKAIKRDATIGSPIKPKRTELNDKDREYLLDLARRSIMAKFEKNKLADEEPPTRILKEKRGAFVTIKIDGELRGCIGLIRAAKPLYQTIIEMAQSAAFEDPRFVPISKDEADRVDFEISALSPLMRVHDIEEIKVGRDGLMMTLDMHSGLLLPQVASEYNWDRNTFLEQTCLKAGLPKNSYKDKRAKIYRFTADVF